MIESPFQEVSGMDGSRLGSQRPKNDSVVRKSEILDFILEEAFDWSS
jgi:hypothetical protein